MTKSTPNFALAQSGLISKEPQKLWGRLPLVAIEGHEPDRAWDIRSNPDGLAGIQVGTQAGVFPSNSGLSAVPIATSQNLARLLQLIKDGQADWRAVGNAAELGRAEVLAKAWIAAQQAAIIAGDYAKADRLIIELYQQLIPWRKRAALANIGGVSQTTAAGVEAAWRATGIDPLSVATNRITSSISSAVSTLPPWALPAAAAGALLIFLLKR